MNPSHSESTYSMRHPDGTPSSDDAGVVRRIAGGDEVALAILYDRWVRVMYSLILHLLRDRDEAEDVVEEAFWHVWQRASTYDETRGTVRTWLLTIGRSRALDRLRARQRHRNELLSTSDAGLAVVADSDPLLDAEGAERRMMVLTALNELPDEQRHALALAYFHGLSQTEIADYVGEPLGTIKTRMRLGMRKLRDKLVVLRRETV